MNNPAIQGIIYGLLFSTLWAAGMVALKTQSEKLSALSMNFSRSVFGSIFYIGAFLITGRWQDLSTIDLIPLLAIFLTVLIGYFLAETLYLSSVRLAGVSRVTPIYWSYPVVTTLLAWHFLGEDLTWIMLIGAIVAVVGVGLISAKGESERQVVDSKSARKGIMLAVGSALGWGVGAAIMKISITGSAPLAVSGVLIWANTLLLSFLPIHIRQTVSLIINDKRFLTNLAFAGIIGGNGLVNFFYVLAVDAIGAGKAAVICATSPLFTTLIAFFFIGETLNRRSLLGMILIVVGVTMNVFPQ